MSTRTTCPRCKQPLAVSEKAAGSYATCPRCQGRFWVSKDAGDEPLAPDPAAPPIATPPMATPPAFRSVPIAAPPRATAGPAAPPVAAPPMAAPPVAAPPVAAPPVAAPPVAAPPVATPPVATAPSAAPPILSAPIPAAPPASSSGAFRALPPSAAGAPVPPPPGTTALPNRKVARLVSAESAQSNVKIAADGQLPSLQLADTGKKDKTEAKSKAFNPLLVFGVVTLAVVLTILEVLYLDMSKPETTKEQEAALEAIAEKYFGNPERGPLASYQTYLREARQARCRGDAKAERRCYRKVLDLLRCEPLGGASSLSKQLPGYERGVTGSRRSDMELEEHIITILNGSSDKD